MISLFFIKDYGVCYILIMQADQGNVYGWRNVETKKRMRNNLPSSQNLQESLDDMWSLMSLRNQESRHSLSGSMKT